MLAQAFQSKLASFQNIKTGQTEHDFPKFGGILFVVGKKQACNLDPV